uniref:Uncharacterized protein n=1 Tax=Panagrolaimus sp. JU765 TaxID=591449 RepID=A0AC34REW7_9BILA
MWQNRAVIVLCVILIGAADFFDSNSFIGGAEARFFSEGGGFEQNLPQEKPLSEEEIAYYDLLLQKQQEQQENAQLSDVLDELYAQEVAAEQQRAAEELKAAQEAENYYADESPSKTKSAAEPETRKLEKPPKVEPAKEVPIPVAENRQPPTAQKKGQSEFVEFVEPPAAKAMKSVDSFDKRGPAEHLSNSPHRGIQLLSTTGNVMFIAIVTLACVVSVVGVVGGAYYFKNVGFRRKKRHFGGLTHKIAKTSGIRKTTLTISPGIHQPVQPRSWRVSATLGFAWTKTETILWPTKPSSTITNKPSKRSSASKKAASAVPLHLPARPTPSTTARTAKTKPKTWKNTTIPFTNAPDWPRPPTSKSTTPTSVSTDSNVSKISVRISHPLWHYSFFFSTARIQHVGNSGDLLEFMSLYLKICFLEAKMAFDYFIYRRKIQSVLIINISGNVKHFS